MFRFLYIRKWQQMIYSWHLESHCRILVFVFRYSLTVKRFLEFVCTLTITPNDACANFSGYITSLLHHTAVYRYMTCLRTFGYIPKGIIIHDIYFIFSPFKLKLVHPNSLLGIEVSLFLFLSCSDCAGHFSWSARGCGLVCLGLWWERDEWCCGNSSIQVKISQIVMFVFIWCESTCEAHFVKLP